MTKSLKFLYPGDFIILQETLSAELDTPQKLNLKKERKEIITYKISTSLQYVTSHYVSGRIV